MLGVNLTARSYQFSRFALPETDYSLDYSLQYYRSDYYVQIERLVTIVVIKLRAKQNALFSFLDLLAYPKLIILHRRKEVTGDTVL